MRRMENDGYPREVYETAIELARMWGVMETLRPMPYMDFPEMRDRVIRWAQEYTDRGQEDLVTFFQEKTGSDSKL